MTLYSISNPFPQILNLKGTGLNDGDVYFGVAGQDPVTNPKTVYWDAGGTQVAAQPIPTSGGYLYRDGSPANVFIDDTYSIKVLDKTAVEVYYQANVLQLEAELIGPDGSNLIGFTQGGVGAVARTAQDKMRDSVSVQDFGAKGGGSPGDAAAINLAIAYGALVGKAVYFPGVDDYYLIDGIRQGTNNVLLTLPAGGNVTLFGDGYRSRLRIPDNFTAGGDYWLLAPLAVGASTNVEISGLCFDGNAANNLVSGSTGTNVRAAYAIKMFSGSNIFIHDNWFIEQPGRNVIVIGNNSNPVDFSNVRIQDNVFINAGGAIAGNEKQNDHSSIYCQSDPADISRNVMIQTNAAFNPFASPNHAVTAIEMHGSNCNIHHNIVINYGTGANCVAQIADSINNSWYNNFFLGMKSNVVSFYAYSGFRNSGLRFNYNTITVDNRTYPGGTGIYQNNRTPPTQVAVENVAIIGNSVEFLATTPPGTGVFGMFLTAISRGTIRGNTIIRSAAAGITISDADASLNINDLDIDDNTFINCANNINNPYSIDVINLDATAIFSNFRIGPNNRIFQDYNASGVTPPLGRGIRVLGPGNIQGVTVYTPITQGIQRNQRVTLSSTANFRNVAISPRTVMCASASAPVSGFFTAGSDKIEHTDPTAGGFAGRIPTTSGSGYEGTWAASTAYIPGQWIKTSANKVLMCLVGGTSDGATEPAPTTLGIVVTDGTVQWAYMDTVLAVFQNVGSILKNGALVLPQLAADPAVSNGSIYYNTGTNKLRGCEGGAWANLI